MYNLSLVNVGSPLKLYEIIYGKVYVIIYLNLSDGGGGEWGQQLLKKSENIASCHRTYIFGSL